jgi:hypothetical protein
MRLPSEREERYAPASPVRLGAPDLGWRAGVKATRIVIAFNWQVARESVRAAWAWLTGTGLIAGATAGLFGVILSAIVVGGFDLARALLAALGGVIILFLILFTANFLQGAPRLVEEERRRLRREARSLERSSIEDPRTPDPLQLPSPHRGGYEVETPEGTMIVRPLPDDEVETP